MAAIVFVKLSPMTNLLHVNKVYKRMYIRQAVNQVPPPLTLAV